MRTYRSTAAPVAEKNLSGIRSICRDVMNAHVDGSAPMDAREYSLVEDIERGRRPMVADRGLRDVLRTHPNPAHREKYLALIRYELGMDGAPVRDAAVIGDIETSVQAPADVAWSRFERLMSRGTMCRSSAQLALDTACAHAGAIAAQIAFLIPLIGS